MRQGPNFTRFLVVAFLISTCAICSAKPPFLKAFLATYGIKPDSALGKARCIICHQPPGPPRRNPYGLAVGAALEAAHQRMVTPDILKSIQMKDMGDGVTFLAKIKSDSLPGVPKPKPAPKPKKPAKPTKKKSKVHHKSKKPAAFLPQNPSKAVQLILLCIAPAAALVRKQPV